MIPATLCFKELSARYKYTMYSDPIGPEMTVSVFLLLLLTENPLTPEGSLQPLQLQ